MGFDILFMYGLGLCVILVCYAIVKLVHIALLYVAKNANAVAPL